ncbi:4Fe4S-binding leucine-rich repeat protein, partial [Methylogaea oryzae]|uniref:4Fe4S-binding leucine-rich repeat protein n=1 Tax=Methylogaea oryzae TaxID=1295382 RepID=UPI000B0B43B9
MDVADVRNLIEAALPDCRVAVEGEGCNFSCVVVSPGFQALGSLQRQRLVLAALQAPLASGALHAITVKLIRRRNGSLCAAPRRRNWCGCNERARGSGPVSELGEDCTPQADCGACPYRQSLLADTRCRPGDVCVRAMSGRQIDRFFRRNPELADRYLADDFWERRAIAVRYASPAAIAPLARDVDEAVR